MSFALTCAAELRATLHQLARLAPSRNPEAFSERKSDIAFRLSQIVDMLEGNFDIVTPEPQAVKGTPGKPRKAVIVDSKGNVIQVDFKARRRTGPAAGRDR